MILLVCTDAILYIGVNFSNNHIKHLIHTKMYNLISFKNYRCGSRIDVVYYNQITFEVQEEK